MSPRALSTVVWAMDPFDAAGPVHGQISSTLRELALRMPLRLIPVHVLGEGEFEAVQTDVGAWRKHAEAAALQAMRQALAETSISQVEPPRVLSVPTNGMSLLVDELVEFATSQGADLIVTGTHARRGLSRFFLGSFAETLVMRSPIPVLTVGPHSRSHGADRILFPTDLGAHSRFLFEHVVSIAAQLRSRIVIFHALPSPIEPILQSGSYLMGGGWIPFSGIFPRERKQRESQMRVWGRWARARGVQTEALIADEGANVPDTIVELGADPRIALIAMGANSGPLSSRLLGSLSREVVRRASCPVWVLHPRKARVGGRRAA
jgi:nucleotide-binding universal stress UspA family protein